MTERIINTDEVKVEGEAADLSAAVGSLTAMIRTECADIDKTRAVPAAVTSALRDLGVFRLLAPREIGGAEVDPVTSLKVVEATSYADV
jgi:alkylation response protein AidB-like acyl-CoA dehydrogenase